MTKAITTDDGVAIPIALEIPGGLKTWVEFNSAEPIVKAVAEAVSYSLQHPDTKMRNLTVNEVKRRIDICMNYLQICYHGIEDITMTRLCDVMPDVLVEALRADVDIQRAVADKVSGALWSPTLARNKITLAEVEEEFSEPEIEDVDPEVEENVSELEKTMN